MQANKSEVFHQDVALYVAGPGQVLRTTEVKIMQCTKPYSAILACMTTWLMKPCLEHGALPVVAALKNATALPYMPRYTMYSMAATGGHTYNTQGV